jgi:hypothetical protein
MAEIGGQLDWENKEKSFVPKIPVLFSLVCLICAITIVADTIYLTVRYFQPIFYFDAWGTVDQYIKFTQNNYRLADLFSQHNEHRILFPRFIFFADFFFGGGSNIINTITIFIIQFLHLALFLRLELKLVRGTLAVTSLSIVTLLLFSYGQSENFNWGFQVQFVGVFAAASLAFWWFSEAAESEFRGARGCLFVVGSLSMSLVATYSMANGLLSCFILVVLALLLRINIKAVFGLAVFSEIVAASFYYDYRLDNSHPPFSVVFLQHPIELFVYTLAYLGGPVRSFGIVAACMLGAVGLSLACFAAARMVLRKEGIAARAALVAIMMFIVVTAGATAFGRFFLGLDEAFSGRYLTPACIFWSAHILYWSSFATAGPSRRVASAIFAVISFVVVVGATHEHLQARPYARENFQNLNLASDALLTGGDFPDAYDSITNDLDGLKRGALFLNQQHLSIFSWPEAQLRHRRLSEAFAAIDDKACFGAFDAVQIIPESGGGAAQGWAWDRVGRKPVERILLVNADDVIVGFGSGGWARPDVRKAVPEVRSKDVGWRGFANVSDNRPLSAYADLDRGRVACKLGALPATSTTATSGARTDAPQKSPGTGP